MISFDHVKTRKRTQQKDDLAKAIAEHDGVTEGIVCLISAVETCFSFQVRRRHETGRIELFRRERKCLHHYLYLIDPEFGFMHVRIQGWIPYECQIYINGREWLTRQLDKAGIGYLRYENSLVKIDDLEAAAELCDRFAHRAWARVLDAFARQLNPILPAVRAVDLRVRPLELDVRDAWAEARVRATSSISEDRSTPSAEPDDADRAASRVVWPVPQPMSRTRSVWPIAAASSSARWWAATPGRRRRR